MKPTDPRARSFADFFRIATGGFTPHCWQLQIAVEGLPDVLSVPTGLGKTEVARVGRSPACRQEAEAAAHCRVQRLPGAEPGTFVIGYDQWSFKFPIATLPGHVQALSENQLT